MALLLSRSSGARAYYQDGQYLVNVRYGDWHDLRDFIQPSNPDVLAIFSQYGPDPWALYDFVCRHVAYKSEVGEMWQFPSETLARGQGDCEDTSILLTSLIRAGGAPNCYVALGSVGGYGHAWCQIDGQILETTFTEARVVPNPAQYKMLAAFNDYEVYESYPGALGEVFELGRNEELKLGLMARALEAQMNKCHHVAEDGWIKYILWRTNGEYFPLTRYRCSKCGEEFVSDGIWWVLQGIPPNVIFEPEPEGDEIIINVGFGKLRSVRQLDVFKG